MPVICVTLAVLNEVLSLNAQESHLKPDNARILAHFRIPALT